MKKIFQVLFSLVLVFLIVVPLVAITPAFATQHNTGTPGLRNSGTPDSGAQSFQVNNPLKFSSVSDFLSALFRAVVAIGIPIAVLFVVWAGLKFVTAQGNPEELKKARSNFLWTIVGIAIFLGAAVLAEIIRQTLRTVGVNI